MKDNIFPLQQDSFDHFEDRYAYNNVRPVIDQTEANWIALQGREVNGWTAIQFKRKFDTCDWMDVPIKVRNREKMSSQNTCPATTSLPFYSLALIN